MSILEFEVNKLDENLNIDINKKKKYGEVFTPFSLINKMLDMMDPKLFLNKNNTFLDMGAGTGNFSICLFYKLKNTLKSQIPDLKERKKHIIQKMIYMSELQRENIIILNKIFGIQANIIQGDFLDYNDKQFNIILGNPPYNSQGLKKVPSNKQDKKINDGKTIWPEFIKHAMNLLKGDGELITIIPSIWMKPDKKKIYNFITNYKIKKLRCFSNTETNKIFNKNAQTPTNILYLKKSSNDYQVLIYDKDMDDYVNYLYSKGEPLPVFGASVLTKIKTSKNLKVIKTNCPSKKIEFSKIRTFDFPYKNIRTCKLSGLKPYLITEYSNKKLLNYNKKKLILAHKMYGFPYLDINDNYGVSTRDNYIILSENENELIKIKEFLSTKTALYLFECTRYRMKYLEKYIFELIPDINKIKNFPKTINDDSIAKFYNLSEKEINAIQNLHKKKYLFY
jgi:tRNA1(Val) A37 N6-methylase TrmN6